MDIVVAITLFVLALLIGVEVIGKVPATLHTPLMSGANSIHGIVIAGVVIVAAHATSPLAWVFIFLARAGHDERRRRLRRHRPHAGDVPSRQGQEEGRGSKWDLAEMLEHAIGVIEWFVYLFWPP